MDSDFLMKNKCLDHEISYCMRIILVRIACILFFLLLLFFPQIAVSGASSGLLLWYQTVLPTLLPAMILAELLLRIHGDIYLTKLFHRPLEKLFHCSRNGAYGVMIGMLTGYPMGAKLTRSLYEQGRITKQEGIHLLHFCNQPSPMFLVGYVSLQTLSKGAVSLQHTILPQILLSVYGSAWLCSMISCYVSKDRTPAPSYDQEQISMNLKGQENPQKTTDSSFLSLLEQSMMNSIEVMVKIGGYMILFSILECFLFQLPLSNGFLLTIISGILEMTTGVRTAAASLPTDAALPLCCFMVSLGGLSGYAQTKNVLSSDLAKESHYLRWKVLQGILAFLLCLVLRILSLFFLSGLLTG
jgi:sporulation integral membrane protein YlbJ